jgi:peptide subunit release factor 1 (eRF1)
VDLVDDAAVVERFFLHEYDWGGKSVAVFSSFPQQFFRAYPLSLPVKAGVTIAERPAIRTLADLLDRYGNYGIALVDKQHARLLHFHLGEILDEEQFIGQDIKRTKRGGSSALVGMRGGITGQKDTTDETVNINLRASSQMVTAFFEKHHVRRILLGGTKEVVAQFRSMLPKSLQSLILNTFAIEMTVSIPALLEKVLTMIAEAGERHNELLVKILIDSASKGRGAVLGMTDTLAAVNENKVLTLAVSENLHISGQYCKQCGLITTRALERCPNCNKLLSSTRDVIEPIIAQVLLKGGTAQSIHSNPTLEKVGSIGAILRY